MEEFGENRDTLIQKKVHLVQSGHFRSYVDSLDKKQINSLYDIVKLDYMGSSEFEWGTLPRSLKRMTINKDFYKVFVFNEYKDENGTPLKVYAPHVFFKNIQNIVDRLVINGYGLQEYCSLHRHIQKNNNEENYYSDYKDSRDFWWDIENDFFMFFTHTDKVLQAMDALRKRKFVYKRNISKNTLNNVYMKALTKPNDSRFTDVANTSIKNHYYDEKTKVHFIEFNENATLENIFMEAIVIAKVDKGSVIFNINEIPFYINESAVSDKILTENGVDLVDSSTYSKKINELISQYNEEFAKRQKQQELVHVLRLVKNKKINI